MERMMKILKCKFLWTVVSCFCSFFLFSSLLSALGVSYLQADHIESLNLYYLQHYDENLDVLIMGSSTVQTGVHPIVLEEEVLEADGTRIVAFNSGQFGGNVLICTEILKDYLGWNRQPPKLIVFGADIHRFSAKGFGKGLYFKYYANQMEILASPKEALISGNFGAMAHGFLRDTSNLLWFVKRSILPDEKSETVGMLIWSKGAVICERSIDDIPRTYTADGRHVRIARWNNFLADYEIADEADKAFRDFIALCKKENIKIVVVNMPMHTKIIEPQNLDAYDTYVEYLVKTCGRSNIRFVNLQEEIDTLGDEEFLNYGHLNRKGAEIVSKYIARNVVIPELQSPHGAH